MKFYFTLMLLFCLSPFQLFSQSESQYLGAIMLNDSSLISYKIVFSEKDGVIIGHSITDLNGPHETKSFLSGTFNEAQNTLVFKESGIIYTKSPVTQEDFCYIHFEGRLKSLRKRQQITGSFRGLYNDGKECINGEIKLANLELMNEKAEKLDKRIDRNLLVKKEDKEKINIKKSLDTLNMNLINKGETLSVFTKDEKITLIIYDAGKEDGDRINLTISGKIILENYTVTKERKKIVINLESDQTLIEVLALNVGTSAPNTVRIEIKDSFNFVRTLTNLDENEKAGVVILKR